MNLDKIITSRHSIRDYKNKDVDYKIIGQILDAAANGPSSGNIQNWKFIVIKDQKKRERIAKSCLDQTWMCQAPVHIAICYDIRNVKTLYPRNFKDLSIQNCSIAASIIMLKATELNLGTCWVSVTNTREMSMALKLPDFFVPSIILTLGYPKDTYKKTTRNSLQTMCYFEEFGFAKKTMPKKLPTTDQLSKRLKIKRKSNSK